LSLGDVSAGAGYLWRGFGMIVQPGLRRYAVGPVAAGCVLFAGLVWLSRALFARLAGWMESFVPEWARVYLEWALWIVFAVAAGGLIVLTFVLLVNLVAAPFHSFLAEAVEARVSGRAPPQRPLHETILRLPIMILSELKKLLYFAMWACLFLIFFLVPILQVAAPFLWFLFCAWMFALGVTDYAMDNNHLPFREMRRRLRSRFWLATGFGAAGFFLATIPVVNLFVMPAAVAGATIMWVERLRHV
jgi:CysZ protein